MSDKQMGTDDVSPGTPGRTVEDLSGILMDCLGTLVAANEIEAACRFAGRACVTLRHDNPKAEQRFNVLLHRLTPRVSW